MCVCVRIPHWKPTHSKGKPSCMVCWQEVILISEDGPPQLLSLSNKGKPQLPQYKSECSWQGILIAVREFEKEKDEREVGVRLKREFWIMGSKSTFEICVLSQKTICHNIISPLSTPIILSFVLFCDIRRFSCTLS